MADASVREMNLTIWRGLVAEAYAFAASCADDVLKSDFETAAHWASEYRQAVLDAADFYSRNLAD